MEKTFTETVTLTPFTKWVGGKRQLLKELNQLKPSVFETYYEPFVGGGALFFDLKHDKAVINDANEDLINAYLAIRDDVEKLIDYLRKHESNNSKEYYYDLRLADRDGRIHKMDSIEKAARILYMLRVNFNGLYRVNSKGQFNTPYGRYKNPRIVDRENLMNISDYLNKNDITIYNSDFAESVQTAQAGDFVYFDPPYVPVTETASFTSYTANGFNYSEQERLRDLFQELDEKGVYVMLSNSDTPIVHKLYKDYKETTNVVYATRMINSDKNGRGKVGEVIITNYK